MTVDVTVKLLAIELQVSVDHLISQFLDIGIHKTGSDYVSEREKKVLFMHINCNKKNIGVLNKLTLQRKTRSTLNVFSSGGKSKKVQIEVRKKHTYLRCDPKISKNVTGNSVFSLCENNDNISDCLILGNDPLVQENIKDNLKTYKKGNLEKRSCKEKNKKILCGEKVIVSKDIHNDSVSDQYRSHIQDAFTISPSNKKNNFISDVSYVSFDTEHALDNDSKKKVNNDRRYRNKQRARVSKSKSSSKVHLNVKYKRNQDRFFDMKYDCDESYPPISHSPKNQKRKLSILTHAFNKPTHVISRDVIIGETIVVSELASKMAIKSSILINIMMKLGTMVTINQVIDQKTAQLVAEKMGHRVILHRENDLESMVMNDRDCGTHINNNIFDVFEYRAPIVTIMGHVDHGKTSLLDCIRSTKVVDSEVGGITQHMGAYCIETDSKKKITFLDTPGHEAFTAMRMRGVTITDLVVLVVAVDDGVMLQTIEAIQHVKHAKIPMIVALNKIDKLDSCDVNRIKNDLAQHGVISEEWGGEIQFVHVSAKLGIGIDNLLDAILLESELLDLKVSYSNMARGVVIESYLDKGKGPVATVLIQEGTLKCGDIILCGLEYGRVRAICDQIGDSIVSAGPSIPVEVYGLSGPPFAGDLMIVVRNERKARELALYRKSKFHSVRLAEKNKDKLENTLLTSRKSINPVKCNIVLKADLQGSVEAISDVLVNLSNDDVKVNIVGSGVGAINETDVSLAISTRSVLLGFNIRADMSARRVIDLENINIFYHTIIYDLINDIKKLIGDMLVPKYEKRNLALAEVRDIFNFPKLGNIAGCMILEGIVRRNNKVRVLRKEIVVYEGELESLRRFKEDVNEVRSGMECGIVIKNCNDIHLGDFIEFFEDVDIKNNTVN